MSNSFNYTMAAPTAADVAQYVFVELTAGNAAACNAVTDLPVGISQFATDSGDDCTYVADGVSYLTVDGSGTAIVAGSMLSPNASGHGEVSTTGDTKAARALDPATTAGAVIRVVFLNAQEASA